MATEGAPGPRPTGPVTPFTPYQKFVVALLAFLQFTIVLDFMILSPLGAILMPSLHITTSQFGMVVSVYAFSAGASGLLAAGFADKFDRKKLLLFFYAGFVLGTLLCATSESDEGLLFARFVTGLFGGVIGSIVFAITTDLFPYEMRGRVMGTVQTAFSASQVLGLPLGLYFSNHWGWHMPFLMIVAVSVIAGIAIILRLKPIDAHLKLQTEKNVFRHLIATLVKPRHVLAFVTTALLSTGGFMLMPFGSAFSVNNLGISLERLPIVYMVTGCVSMVTGPLLGKMSDSIGKFRMFLFGSIVTIIMVLVYTHLELTPIEIVIAINALMFVGIMSRMISASTLMSAVPDPASRGSFMSINSSLQQISGGIASVIAGLIVVQTSSGRIEHFDSLGYVVVLATLFTMFMMFFVNRMLGREKLSKA